MQVDRLLRVGAVHDAASALPARSFAAFSSASARLARPFAAFNAAYASLSFCSTASLLGALRLGRSRTGPA